jgi:hypothetical protein
MRHHQHRDARPEGDFPSWYLHRLSVALTAIGAATSADMLPTGLALLAGGFVFASLHLWLTALTQTITGLQWLALAFKRAPKAGRRPSKQGHDIRAIQGWLGHRSITSTAVYTALAPNRFKDFWRD